jgi:hypothetical protein
MANIVPTIIEGATNNMQAIVISDIAFLQIGGKTLTQASWVCQLLFTIWLGLLYWVFELDSTLNIEHIKNTNSTANGTNGGA